MVVSERDYLAFGAVMAGRSLENEEYTYSFNGKELDLSTGWQDYGFRDYNPVYKRFDNVDPLTQKYPELTPYQFASNTPIAAIDLDGLERYLAITTKGTKYFGENLQRNYDFVEHTHIKGDEIMLDKVVATTVAKEGEIMFMMINSHGVHSRIYPEGGRNENNIDKQGVLKWADELKSNENVSFHDQAVIFLSGCNAGGAGWDNPSIGEIISTTLGVKVIASNQSKCSISLDPILDDNPNFTSFEDGGRFIIFSPDGKMTYLGKDDIFMDKYNEINVKLLVLTQMLLYSKGQFEMQNDQDITQGMNKVVRIPSETKTQVDNSIHQKHEADMLNLRELDEQSEEKVQSVELPKRVLKRAERKQQQQKSSN